MPPKLLKVTTNVGKALQAGRYSGSMVPLPPKIVLQANFARKEVHLPGRSYRRKRRPHRRPPPSKIHREYPSEPYNRGKYRGTHRPSGGKFRSPPSSRPPYRDPDYYEQEVEDNGSDIDYDFEDSPYRSYLSDQDIVQQADEFHPSAYKSTRDKNVNHRDPEEPFEAATVRKPRPSVKKPKNRPKQFRESLGQQHSLSGKQHRPYYYHSDENEEIEEEEFEEAPRPRKRAKIRKSKPRDNLKYFDDEEYSSNFDNSDNYYHDRAFDAVTTGDTRDSEIEYREYPEGANKSKIGTRPDRTVSGSDSSTKPLSWDDQSHGTPLKWAPTVEPPQLTKLEQPIRVIPVWHILHQIPGSTKPEQQMNSDESKPLYTWVDPKPHLNGFKYSSQKKETKPPGTGNNGIVANRLVADSIKWNPIGEQSHAVFPSPFPAFNYSGNFWSSGSTLMNNDKQWSVPLTDGEIIYGSRLSDKPKHRIPDIGYGQGMELVNENEDGVSWQVY